MHIYNKQDPTASPYLAYLLEIIGYIVLMLGQNGTLWLSIQPVVLTFDIDINWK